MKTLNVSVKLVYLGIYFTKKHVKLGTNLSTHRSVPHRITLNGAVRGGVVRCEYVRMRHVCS